MAIIVNLLEGNTGDQDTQKLIEQLAHDYSGRRSINLLWKWSNLDPKLCQWDEDAAQTWEQSFDKIDDIPLELLKNALFDHPSDDVYRSYLSYNNDIDTLAEQIEQVLACCDTCPIEDRSYRFAQWLPCIAHTTYSDAFLAGVKTFHLKLSLQQRNALDHQLKLICEQEGMSNSVDEAVDAAISLIHALCAISNHPKDLTPPWQNDLEQLHRSLAHLMTLQLRAEQDEGNKVLDVQRQQGVEVLQSKAPELVGRIEEKLQNFGVNNVLMFMKTAIAQIQAAVEDKEPAVPTDSMLGLRHSLWATRATNHAKPWSYQSPITEQMVLTHA